MLRRLFSRLTSLATVAVVLLIGVGVALSGNLPSGAQDAVAETAGAFGFDVPTSGEQGQGGAQDALVDTQDAAPRSDDHVQAVHETIGDYATALDAWTTCVAEAAASRGSLQSDPETRAEGERFDPKAECDPKPKLNLPRPTNDGFDGPQGGDTPDKPGRPDDPGKPDSPGKPDNPGTADNARPPSKRP
jgi:hypothetical protein